MRLYSLFVFMILFVVPGTIIAQEAWSLEDCIKYAMIHNLDIQKSGLTNQSNEENYHQAVRNLLPGLSAGAGYGASYGKSVDPLTNDVVYHSFYSNSLSASTSVSLFQGFRQINTIAFCKTLVSAGQYDQQTLKATLSFKIMDAFFNAIFYKREIDLSEELLSLSRWNRDYVKGMIRNGLKAESDILEVDANLATDELKKTQAQNDYEQALLQLKQLINLEEGKTFSIKSDVPAIDMEAQPNYLVDSLYGQALKCLPDIQSARANVKALKIDLARTKSSYFPSLSFYAGTSTGYYQTLKDAEGNVIPFRNQLSNNASEYLGFSLGIPILDRGSNRSQTKLARIQLKKSELELLQEQQKLYQTIDQDWKKLLALKKEIDQGTIQVKALEATELILRKKFEKGLSGQYEYSQAKNQLAQAKSDLLRTSLQYEITRRTIDYYQGLPIPGMQ